MLSSFNPFRQVQYVEGCITYPAINITGGKERANQAPDNLKRVLDYLDLRRKESSNRG